MTIIKDYYAIYLHNITRGVVQVQLYNRVPRLAPIYFLFAHCLASVIQQMSRSACVLLPFVATLYSPSRLFVRLAYLKVVSLQI